MAAQKYKRSMKNYLIDSKFQLKHTAIIMSLCLAIFAVLGWFYYQERKMASEIMDVNQILQRNLPAEGEDSLAMDPEFEQAMAAEEGYDRSFDSVMEEENEQRDSTAVYLMLGTVALLVILLAVAGIYMTHKIAGPLFALNKFMNSLREGDWDAIRPFRKGDEFKYLSDTFTELAKDIRERHGDTLESIKEVAAKLEAGRTDEAKAKLAELIKAKEEYLQG
jgi:methyl-accepting chemotaxis protein